jgi:ppGpp synthetase/RelA/SpoT-type nucleotidyltranferase
MPIFLAWGNFVAKTIIDELQKKSVCIDTFIKIPVKPRLKSMDSLLSKANRPEKSYANPYDDITDKIGIRFVVLLIDEIDIVGDIIKQQSDKLWRASLDKDYNDERDKNPDRFTYESKHYVVYNLQELQYDDKTIPINTPCEIQIRTLLQHAYAEMSHDAIYKSSLVVEPCVRRFMARSMALVESADHFFDRASKEITEKSQLHEAWNKICRQHYPQSQAPENQNTNMSLLDKLMPLIKSIPPEEFGTYCQAHDYLFNSLLSEEKYNHSWIYRQPAVLIIYFLIQTRNAVLQRNWPLSESILRMLLCDLGITSLDQ